ncbi:hypothetical protein AOL_s00006g230 [Orbilia oligospora ATCC 24927]|uniref:Copper acquisition factor BIM1-like domain-containing protein n=2 Tax=Orbilia oligospora TaxID=2813651 RepID=G1X029_ARTOA|nr:hypothetical protein AOL_s00006g230 [Orbilia oligospora ATCC 24927]EGX53364.1 hypothetical protein AOL_s00006g230 [Orbilia oligospora ATCC 24927]KAF3291192.1 hypothetical protein TWF970_000423 [Orbilia oligospora]
MFAKSLLLSLLTVSVANAHFTLRYPEPLGKSAAKQDQGPCGGYSIDGNTPVTQFHVDGDAVAYASSHPSVKVLFRIIEGNSPDGPNSFKGFPIVEQYGSGDFCEPKVTAPKNLVGKQGIVQVVQNAVDGMLYACAYVKFVSGVNSNLPDTCKNGTGVDADFADDASLEALFSSSTDTPTGSGSTPAPTTSNPPSAGSLKSFSMVAGVVGIAVAVLGGL